MQFGRALLLLSIGGVLLLSYGIAFRTSHAFSVPVVRAVHGGPQVLCC
jgi:hypothetical protein